MRKTTVLGLALMALSGCAAASEPPAAGPSEPMRPPPGKCDAGAVQSFVGQPVTQDVGSAIREASGARSLRWGPPDTAWTMDYRDDRVNVRYGRDKVISAVTCG